MQTEAPEEELEDEAAALPPASSSSASYPFRPPEEIKPRQEELAGPERRPRWSSPRARVMTASGGASGTRGTGTSARCRSRLVLRLHGLDARPLPPQQPPLRQPPKETT